jgi:hypothetical protein
MPEQRFRFDRFDQSYAPAHESVMMRHDATATE